MITPFFDALPKLVGKHDYLCARPLAASRSSSASERDSRNHFPITTLVHFEQAGSRFDQFVYLELIATFVLPFFLSLSRRWGKRRPKLQKIVGIVD